MLTHCSYFVVHPSPVHGGLREGGDIIWLTLLYVIKPYSKMLLLSLSTHDWQSWVTPSNGGVSFVVVFYSSFSWLSQSCRPGPGENTIEKFCLLQRFSLLQCAIVVCPYYGHVTCWWLFWGGVYCEMIFAFSTWSSLIKYTCLGLKHIQGLVDCCRGR